MRIFNFLKPVSHRNEICPPTQSRSARFSFEDGILLLNPDVVNHHIGQETLVICGSPRGGTSIVAYALHEMGYFLGESLHPLNYEDRAFLNVIPPQNLDIRDLSQRENFLTLMQMRNAENARWGFKLPRATFYLESLCKNLRNPIVLLCLRNPMATMASVHAREPDLGTELEFLSDVSRRSLNALDWLMTRDDIGAIVMNIDHLQAYPEKDVEAMRRLLDLTGDPASIAAQIRTGGYANKT
jgi:hypothetical protein